MQGACARKRARGAPDPSCQDGRPASNQCSPITRSCTVRSSLCFCKPLYTHLPSSYRPRPHQCTSNKSNHCTTVMALSRFVLIPACVPSGTFAWMLMFQVPKKSTPYLGMTALAACSKRARATLPCVGRKPSGLWTPAALGEAKS